MPQATQQGSGWAGAQMCLPAAALVLLWAVEPNTGSCSGARKHVAQFPSLPGAELTGTGRGEGGRRASRKPPCWWTAGPGLLAQASRQPPRGRASLPEGTSRGFWHGESGDRNICSRPGKALLTPPCSPLLLLVLWLVLTSSLL